MQLMRGEGGEDGPEDYGRGEVEQLRLRSFMH